MKPQDLTQLLCHAIICDGFDETALNEHWPFVEVKVTTVGIGSGESRSWRNYVLIRQNGAQTYREPADVFHYQGLQGVFGEKAKNLIQFAQKGPSTFYVLKPA